MSLIKNSFLNIVGYVVPTLVAIPALGYLARSLGAERFGIFTLAMALVGYAGIFDAGMTRAVIREIAIYRNDFLEKKRIASTAVFFVLCLGIVGTALMFFLSFKISNILNVSKIYEQEVAVSLKILSFSIPIFLVNQIWLAVLEGEEKFFNVNVQKWISSSLLAGLPALMLIMYKTSLVGAITGLLIGRILALLVNIIFSYKFIFSSGIRFHRYIFARLIRYGGWITISNIISPVMSYFDRFIVSYLSGAHVVAFYSAPAEAVSRLSIIPAALSRAVFPKLSSAKNDNEKKVNLKLSYILLSAVCGPIVLICFLFSEHILVLWLGENFKGLPSLILRILLIGFLFNCFAQIPFTLIQAAGKSKVTASLHMSELFPYLILLFVFVKYYGIIGAAIAWTSRMIVDSLILFYLSQKIRSI
ncbi:flippase [Escherichia albertii]|uniref:Putative O-antigen transporter n=2 Tax=Enterobacteriaceae TaxID=543 RepID=A0A5A4U7R1_ESCAL|nr:flippase [Escherichia albertii]EGM8072888.1 flippase [Escherichia albertii]EJM0810395.1 flippase [Escherichia albertii]EJM1766057.1 flippase [Escherichia albertii]EJM2115189.1 flippase [Escherichia albertii]EJO0116320.1 flippase [Escherichia albertii]